MNSLHGKVVLLRFCLPDASQKNSKRASCPAGSRSSPQDSIGSNITFVQPVYQELEHPSPTRAIPTRVNVQTQSTAHWEALVASSKVENEEADAAEWQALIQYNQLRHQLEFAFQRDQEEKRVQGLQDEQEKVLDGIKERLVEERTRSFTAEGTVSALEVDLANQKDDYEAEIEDLKDERDAALAALKEREEELKYQTSVKEEYLEAAAKATRERELLEDALEVKQQVVQSVSLASQSLQARCDRLEAQNVALLEEQAQGSTDQHIQDQAIITHFEKENAELRRTQDATEAENRELGQNLHQAIIDVGFTHAQNMGYRAAMEDENPARTAHLDGLLKVKDDAYHELEERVSMLSNAVAEERTFKAIRNEEAAGEIEGLQGELEWREAALQAVTQSRDLLQERTDSILQLLKSKIHHDDAVKAICSSHDAINTDNEMLISTLQHRDRIVSTATKETSALRTKIFDLETAAAKSHDQLQRQQSEISALEINDTRLQWITDTQPETFAHEKAALEARLQEQTLQIRNLLASGLSAGVIAFMDSKDAQIAQLQGQLQEWVSGYHQLQARLREGQSEYCPLFDNAPVWEEEKLRHRLRVAEMLLGGPLGEVVRGYEGWGPREAWFGLGRGGVGE